MFYVQMNWIKCSQVVKKRSKKTDLNTSKCNMQKPADDYEACRRSGQLCVRNSDRQEVQKDLCDGG